MKHKRKRKLKKISIIFMTVSLLMIILSINSSAVDTSFYTGQFGEYFVRSSIFKNVFNLLGWGVVKLFILLVNACESLFDSSFKLVGFIFSAPVKNFIEQYRAVWIALFAASLLLFGAQLMLGDSNQDRSRILKGITLSLVVFFGLTTLMSNFNTITKAAVNTITADGSTSAEAITAEHITDLRYLDSKGFSKLEKQNNNYKGENAKKITEIDINATIDPGDSGLKQKDIFEKYLSTDADGNYILEDIDHGGFSFNDDCYYRYKVDYVSIIFTLLATMIVFIFCTLKTVKLVFELVVNQFIAMILSATDWQSGQKIKEAIKAIGGAFFSIFMMFFTLKIYLLMTSYISQMNVSGIVKALLILIAALAVIQGPNLIEKVFGIDAGLGSMFQAAGSLFFGTRAFAGAAGAVGKAAGGFVKGSAKATGGAAAFAGGFGRGLRNAKNNSGISDIAEKQNGKTSGMNNSEMSKDKSNSTKSSAPVSQNKNSNLNQNDTSSGISNSAENRKNQSVIFDSSKPTDSNSRSEAQNNLSENTSESGTENSYDGRNENVSISDNVENKIDKDNIAQSVSNPALEQSRRAMKNEISGRLERSRTIAGTVARSSKTGKTAGEYVGNKVADRKNRKRDKSDL